MKEWPKEGAIDFESAVNPIVKLIRDAIDDAKMYAPREYDGYNTGHLTQAVSSDPAWHLSKEGMKYHREHDRDVIDVLCMILFQVGIEQGSRLCAERDHKLIEIEALSKGFNLGYKSREARKRKKG